VEILTLTLCESSTTLPTGEWIFERKLDGVRALAVNGELYNRKSGTNRLNRNITKNFPEIRPDPKCVLDGEIVVDDGDVYDVIGRSNMIDQKKINLLSKVKPAVFVVFDILFYDGKDLRNFTLFDRKGLLSEVNLGDGVRRIEFTKEGGSLWKRAEEEGWEGVVAKRLNSIYAGERFSGWRKIKRFKEKVFPILGWEITEEGGFVILIPVNGGEQRVVVNGIDDQRAIMEGADLKAEIQFLEVSKNGMLRHPSFRGLVNCVV